MGHFFNFRANTPTTAEERAWLGDPAQEPTGERCNVPNDYPPLINFEVDLYPFGKPMMADANQRGIGDCCAIATFSALAYCYPDFIQSIITDNGDDTYTVKMYDPNRERIDVCVSNKFWAGDPSYLSAAAGKGATQATWATVLEKALMKYREVYYGNPNLGGIGTPDVAPPFTGCGYGYAYNFNSAVLAQAGSSIAHRGALFGRRILGAQHSAGWWRIDNRPCIRLHALDRSYRTLRYAQSVGQR